MKTIQFTSLAAQLAARIADAPRVAAANAAAEAYADKLESDRRDRVRFETRFDSLQRITLSFGVMPAFDAFEAAFNVMCPNGETYAIRNCERVGDADFDASELYAALESAVDDHDAGDDEAGCWASCVLSTLAIEWI